MNYHQIFLQLKSQFPGYLIEENHPLAPHTTLRIGGPADIFFQPKNSYQFKSIINFVYQNNLPLTIIGNGSNVLISDTGIRGLVIKNITQPKIKLLADNLPPINPSIQKPTLALSTQRMENEPDRYLDFSKLDYDESAYPRVSVQVSSGTPLPMLISQSIASGWTGLQWFAYIPGTIGGAIWYNIHGGKYHFSQYLHKITVFNLNTGRKESYRSSELDWGYDTSPFQKNPNLIILSATLRLFKGDPQLARATATAWIQQKSKVQPMNSAGSIFQNPSLAECQTIWGEQKSTGWIIDHELGLKNHRIGDAVIGPQHANIFTNQGHATATDFMQLIQYVQAETKKKFNLTLRPEIKFIGEY